MKLEFVNASDTSKCRASIHGSGRLSFNGDAAKYMDIQAESHYLVAFDHDFLVNQKMYLVESGSEEFKAAKVSKAGPYYFIKLGHVLDKKGIDYKKLAYTFTVQENDAGYEGKRLFELIGQEPSPRNGDEQDDQEE